MECIIHYKDQSRYSVVKKINDNCLTRIKESKLKRLGIGGTYSHNDQCELIPDSIDVEKHGIHLEPCYKRFTSILGNKKFQVNVTPDTRTSNRLSSPLLSPTAAWVYPKECNICLKFRAQHKNKRTVPYKIVTYDAEQKIKAAANANVKQQDLYNEISSLDLIAKEFKVHTHCYKNFTRGLSADPKLSSSSSTNVSEPAYSTGDFEAVKEHVTNEVIEFGRAVSMKVIHEFYGLGIGDTRYRNKLKQRLQKHFEGKIAFLSPPSENFCEVVVSTSCLEGKDQSKVETIKMAAKMIRDDILEKFKNLDELNWPPSSEELSMNIRQPPDSVYTFLNSLMKFETKHSGLSTNQKRLVDSYAYDFVHGVKRGKILQKKHFLLGLGIHNLTGSRKIVDIIHKHGHCISYNLVCEIETAQAECAIKASQETNLLPSKPKNSDASVFTHYWVDNFEKMVKIDIFLKILTIWSLKYTIFV